jgi:Na+-transporting methylmalonyl-CoA/oxaloacetate decarboxylase gamma subunit
MSPGLQVAFVCAFLLLLVAVVMGVLNNKRDRR